MSSKEDKQPAQIPQDAERQKRKQEREFREQQAGTYEKPENKDQSSQNATKEYEKIKSEEKDSQIKE